VARLAICDWGGDSSSGWSSVIAGHKGRSSFDRNRRVDFVDRDSLVGSVGSHMALQVGSCMVGSVGSDMNG